jgi:hypothetical protein
MYRYEVQVDDRPHTFGLFCSGYSGPLHVAAAMGKFGHVVEFWCEYDTGYDEEQRTFQVYGTGQELPENSHWVGTCQRTPEGLVWHLYELDEVKP